MLRFISASNLPWNIRKKGKLNRTKFVNIIYAKVGVKCQVKCHNSRRRKTSKSVKGFKFQFCLYGEICWIQTNMNSIFSRKRPNRLKRHPKIFSKINLPNWILLGWLGSENSPPPEILLKIWENFHNRWVIFIPLSKRQEFRSLECLSVKESATGLLGKLR